MMSPFTWTNCWADIHAGSNGRTVDGYISDVVEPAVAGLARKIGEFAESREPWAPFAKSDMEDLRSETMKAFSLAVQSLWERQLRCYLSGCAKELKLGDAVMAEVHASQWHRVEKAFTAVRGINLRDFPSYPLLEALHLLGNVCRHGDGPSVARLHALRSDLWPDLTAPMVDESSQPIPPSAALIRIEPEHLRAFAAAITRFWADTHYIYLESIDRKHENVVAEIARLRAERSWLPQARPPTGDQGDD